MNREKFLSKLMENLILEKNSESNKYLSKAEILGLFRAVVVNLDSGIINRHLGFIKKTCQDLKIKNTRDAIVLALKG